MAEMAATDKQEWAKQAYQPRTAISDAPKVAAQ